TSVTASTARSDSSSKSRRRSWRPLRRESPVLSPRSKVQCRATRSPPGLDSPPATDDPRLLLFDSRRSTLDSRLSGRDYALSLVRRSTTYGAPREDRPLSRAFEAQGQDRRLPRVGHAHPVLEHHRGAHRGPEESRALRPLPHGPHLGPREGPEGVARPGPY